MLQSAVQYSHKVSAHKSPSNKAPASQYTPLSSIYMSNSLQHQRIRRDRQNSSLSPSNQGLTRNQSSTTIKSCSIVLLDLGKLGLGKQGDAMTKSSYATDCPTSPTQYSREKEIKAGKRIVKAYRQWKE